MYLLDTMVVSEYLKKNPSQKVIGWLDKQEEHTLYISCLTIAELKKGYHKLKAKAKSKRDYDIVEKIGTWIQKLESRFEDNIIPIDTELLNLWATFCGQAAARGKRLPIIDSLLVATAETHGLTAVTRNIADFENCSKSVKLYNPY